MRTLPGSTLALQDFWARLDSSFTFSNLHASGAVGAFAFQVVEGLLQETLWQSRGLPRTSLGLVLIVSVGAFALVMFKVRPLAAQTERTEAAWRLMERFLLFCRVLTLELWAGFYRLVCSSSLLFF